MLLCIIGSFLIGVAFLLGGIYYKNNDLLNVGVSFLSGTIVGIFCNVGITKYYRKKDETIQANNKKLLDEKSDYLKQINSLSDFISAYEDVIANLNAFMCSNCKCQ